jgi:hypothetical protein
MYHVDRKQGLGLAAAGIAGLMLGALVFGNLFTLVTGEYGGVGPGLMASLSSSVKVDTVTTITTSDPGRYVGSDSSVVKWLTLQIWQVTGKMTPTADGRWDILWSRHAGVLTSDGKDWLEDQISDSPSATTIAKYVGVTRDAHAPAAADHNLWSEINTGGGLDRVAGTYTSTGVGTWTVVKAFTADAGYTAVQTTGLYWDDTDGLNGTMLCADTFAPATLAASDTLTVTWTLSVS